MKIKIIKQENYVVSDWSGGKTTEIFLSPSEGDYQKRDFDYRISSATVDKDHSIFTSLPGYKRILLTLNGNISLIHEFSRFELSPFRIHRFKGEETTESFGHCTDFNLIYREDYKGDVKVIWDKNEVMLEKQTDYLFYFLRDCQITISNQKNYLQANESLAVTEESSGSTAKLQLAEKNDLPIAIVTSVRK